jgi:chromate transport protein ChrA
MVDNNQAAKTIGDVLSITTVVGTLAQVLPSIAAIFTIVWTLIRIYETKTVQSWLRRLRG